MIRSSNVDWSASMQQTFEYYIVDPNTWKDSRLLTTVKSCTINRDSEAETLGSATFDIIESVGECYIRVYLITIQNGVKEKHPLGTFLVQTPSSNFDGKVRNVSMDAYTPLMELKENYPPIGYYIPKSVYKTVYYEVTKSTNDSGDTYTATETTIDPETMSDRKIVDGAKTTNDYQVYECLIGETQKFYYKYQTSELVDEVNVMDVAYRLARENARAPVIKADNPTVNTSDFVASTDDNWLSFLSDFISSNAMRESSLLSSRNLLKNSNFSSGTDYWVINGVTATVVNDSYHGTCLKMDSTTLGSTSQRIYSDTNNNFSHTADQTYTLSFYAKSDTNATLQTNVAGSVNVKNYTLSNTWARYTHTYTASNDGSLTFWLNEANVSAYITKVKLELGKTATTWKSSNLTKSIAAYTFSLDELGRITFAPKQEAISSQPVWTYDDSNSSILYPELSMDHDLYGIPNVVEVVYTSGNTIIQVEAKNNDIDSPTSIQKRGRKITYRDTNPSLLGNPSEEQVQEYADNLLKSLSTVEYTITYTHGYCPVRLGDCVRLNYARSGLSNIKAKVISQSIKCAPGCPVTEKAVFTAKLWR